jgi:thiosulfate dehydrogenase [quinone] large subunit
MSVNTFESRIGNFTVTGKAHSLAAWFVLSLRLMMGIAFTYAGLEKVMESGWNASGYLGNVAATNGNPLMGMFEWMATTAWFVDFVNVAVPWGELAIGLALIVGFMTRFAAFWGAFMMAMFYFGNWSVEHGLINGDFAYMLVFLTVAALGAGRILGLDTFVENYDVGGEKLIERYPRLDYILG